MYSIRIQATLSVIILLAITGCLESPVIIQHEDIISIDDLCSITQLPYSAEDDKYLELEEYVLWLRYENNSNVSRDMVVNKFGNAELSSIVTRKTKDAESVCIEDIYILSLPMCTLGQATYYLFSYDKDENNTLRRVIYFSDGIPKESTSL